MIIERIQEQFPNLTKKQMEISRYLIENPEEICHITLAQLSQKVSATELTILRYCEKIGYSSFRDLKGAFREYTQELIQRSYSPEFLATSSTESSISETESRLLKIALRELSATSTFLSSLDLKLVTSGAQFIREGKKCYIFAHNLSHILGQFLQKRLISVGIHVKLINLSDIASLSEAKIKISPEDVAVFFAFPKYHAPLCQLSEEISTSCRGILGITDSLDSPIAKNSEILLICPTESCVFHNSLTLPMAVINLLASSLALENPMFDDSFNI